jgi:predicted amidohydrolase YtcJ
VLDREEALRGFTLDAAYSLFLDREVGSLEVGKRADLVVFDRDIVTVPAPELLEARALWTLIDGQVVHRPQEAP